jgi:hypothetical protein
MQALLTQSLILPLVLLVILFIDYTMKNPISISLKLVDKKAPEPITEPVVEEPIRFEYTIRELKAIASNWNKENPTDKIRKWDRMNKEDLYNALEAKGAL